MAKTFFDARDFFADPQASFQLWLQSAKEVVKFNTLENPGYRKAIAITPMKRLSNAEASGLGLTLPDSSSRIQAYSYVARLDYDWCEHWFLPDPCNPRTSANTGADIQSSHINIVGQVDGQTTVIINPGDVCEIDMEKGTFLNNLQKGRHSALAQRGARAMRHFQCPGEGVAGNIGLLPPYGGGTASKLQQDYYGALSSAALPFSIPVTVKSWTRSAEGQYDAMSGLPVGDLAKYGMPILAAKIKAGAKDAAVAIIDAYVKGGGKGFPHMLGRALDIKTGNLSDADVGTLIQLAIDINGRVLLEPRTTNCWNIQGHQGTADSGHYGENARRFDSRGQGKCSNEHLHITIPADWKAPGSV